MKFSLYTYGVFLFIGGYIFLIEGLDGALMTVCYFGTVILILKWVVDTYQDVPSFNALLKRLF